MNLRWVLAWVGAASLIIAGCGLYLKGRAAGVAFERPKLIEAQDRLAVATLEVQGGRENARRVDLAVRQRSDAARSLARLNSEILTDEGAHAPLDTHRIERLRAHDQQLCKLAQDLQGCAPP
jgi:hypothetical protein